MNRYNSIDLLLKKALSSTHVPDRELNERIKNRMKERIVLKKRRTKSIRVILIAAMFIIVMSFTVFAVRNLLSADECANHFEACTVLADAFKSEDAIQINESVTSGEYIVTLLGMVSGKRLTWDDIDDEKTYAVVAIEKQSGKMPDTMDDKYDDEQFFVSPLIKGLKPWQVNICTLNGGYREAVIDGVMYRLIDCDSIEMFADRGIYLCISSSNFYDINAFVYNSKSGEIRSNPEYDGVNVLFDLPIDKTKADPKKAQEFLNKEVY